MIRRIALAVFVTASLWLALLFSHDSQASFRSYLFAYLYWLSFPLGALGLLMTFNLTGGRWGVLTRGILEAMARTTAGMALLLLPLFAGLEKLFPWADPIHGLPPHKAVYFNLSFFVVRAVVYFVCWLWLARGLTSLFRSSGRIRMLSGGGLVVFGFTITFASIDWQMSLEPFWYSTIYGMLFAIGQALQTWAFAVAVLCVALSRTPEAKPADVVLRDVGNILLTLVILWAYLSFMQYLIIWSGNLPEEVRWVLARTRGGWEIPAVLLAVFQFAAPFSALLLRPSKERISVLRAIAVWIVIARIVEQYWLVMPAFSPRSFHISLSDLAAWAGIGGFWIWLFLGKLASRPLFGDAEEIANG